MSEGAQIDFGDLTQYLNYGPNSSLCRYTSAAVHPDEDSSHPGCGGLRWRRVPSPSGARVRVRPLDNSGETLDYHLFFGFVFIYFLQHCFICRPSDSTVSEDAGIETQGSYCDFGIG
jgi:hypothetical protein